jgi:hypothetical protein
METIHTPNCALKLVGCSLSLKKLLVLDEAPAPLSGGSVRLTFIGDYGGIQIAPMKIARVKDGNRL